MFHERVRVADGGEGLHPGAGCRDGGVVQGGGVSVGAGCRCGRRRALRGLRRRRRWRGTAQTGDSAGAAAVMWAGGLLVSTSGAGRGGRLAARGAGLLHEYRGSAGAGRGVRRRSAGTTSCVPGAERDRRRSWMRPGALPAPMHQTLSFLAGADAVAARQGGDRVGTDAVSARLPCGRQRELCELATTDRADGARDPALLGAGGGGRSERLVRAMLGEVCGQGLP